MDGQQSHLRDVGRAHRNVIGQQICVKRRHADAEVIGAATPRYRRKALLLSSRRPGVLLLPTLVLLLAK
jgi:hypothetical protein